MDLNDQVDQVGLRDQMVLVDLRDQMVQVNRLLTVEE